MVAILYSCKLSLSSEGLRQQRDIVYGSMSHPNSSPDFWSHIKSWHPRLCIFFTISILTFKDKLTYGYCNSRSWGPGAFSFETLWFIQRKQWHKMGQTLKVNQKQRITKLTNTNTRPLVTVVWFGLVQTVNKNSCHIWIFIPHPANRRKRPE